MICVPPSFQITKNNMGGACSMYREMKGACMVLVGKRNETRPLKRHGYRREDNIKIDIQEIGGNFAWIDVAQNRDR
jgi:hypothetical protein